MMGVFAQKNTERLDVNINGAGLMQQAGRYCNLVGIMGKIDNYGHIYVAAGMGAAFCIGAVQ